MNNSETRSVSKNGLQIAARGVPAEVDMYLGVLETGEIRFRSNRKGPDGLPVSRTKEQYPYSYDEFVVWDSRQPSKSVVYSDRLYQWDSKKYNALCLKHFGDIGQYFDSRPREKIEAFLRDYYDTYADFELTRICQGCNAATGYPYWVFDFTYSRQLEQLTVDMPANPEQISTAAQ